MAVEDSLTYVDAAMERYADGDEDAFSELYDGLAARVFGLIFSGVRSRVVAEDLTQTVFLSVHAARGRFVRGAPVWPWVASIARHAVCEHYRQQKRARVLIGNDVDAEAGVEASGTPADLLIERETFDVIQVALARLPALHRDAFSLVHLNGLSIGAAATLLGLSQLALRLRLHKVRRAIRCALK